MIPRRLALQLGGLMAGSGLFGQTLAAADDLPKPRADLPVPLSYFGMHVHDPRQVWPALRFGRLRLWDTRTTWFNLQPEAERFDFERLDGIIDRAVARRVEPVMCLGMPPRWAAFRPDESSPYGASAMGAASEPRSLVEWARFVKTTAERYLGRIRNYEVWNEVNAGAGFYTGSPEALVEIQRVAYETLKAVDSKVTVIAPSSVGESEGQLAWFDRFHSLLRGRYCDVVSYHLYTPRRSPEAMLALVTKVRRIAERNGAGLLPIWNTESGYRVNWGQKKEPGGTMNTWPNLPPQTAAAWAARAAILGWSAGLDAFFWYAYDDGNMGFVAPGERSSVVSDALSIAVERMVGSRVTSLSRQGGVMLAVLKREGSSLSVVWAEDDVDRLWTPPSGVPARAAAQWDGTPLPFELNGTLRVGALPVVVAADAAMLRLGG